MTINTGISPQLLNPQTFHAFTYSFATPGLIPLPLRIALIGAKTAGGTGVAGTVYEVPDPQTGDTLFGSSSELALMCRAAFAAASKLGSGPRIFAVPVAESAGVANVKTITSTGAATASGVTTIRVAGRTVQAGISSGDSANTIATSVSNALKAIQDQLPVIVSVATNVVTLTHATKGVNGADISASVDSQVAGNTLAVANTVTGTLATDHQTALDALSALPMDGVVFANHASADITEIVTDATARWGTAEKRWRWYFVGEMGTIGTATALATAANDRAVLIASMEGCLNTAGEMATSLAVATFSRERPNANYDGVVIPLYPPPAAVVYTPTEVETALAAGLTPLTAFVDPFTHNVTDGVARIVRMVTSKTTSNSQPFAVLRDLCVSRTGVYIAQQIDAAYEQRFGSLAVGPDGTLLTDDTIGQVKDMIENILRLIEANNVLRNVESDLLNLRVERDVVSGRLDVDVAYTVVVGLHQIAAIHRVRI